MRPRSAQLVLVLALAMLATACPDKRPKYPTCDGDKDCKPGEKCVNKRCVQCAEDADCDPGQRCENGACVAIEGWCSTDGDCPNGGVCKDNKCVPCQADAECGEGGRCRDGRCLRKGQCDTDDDCPEDADCIRGVCVKGGAAAGAGAIPSCTLNVVYFDFDAATIREDSKTALQQNADCLSQSPRGVMVVGHTDPRGPDEYNIALSDQRGNAVADYLSRLGVDRGRLRIVPKGEAEATGTDEDGWAQDRRVELAWE